MSRRTPPEKWGTDPLNRALRVISVLAFLSLIMVVVLDPDRANNIALESLLVGAILLQLGYDVALRLPDIIQRRNGTTTQTRDNETGEEARHFEQTGELTQRPKEPPRE